MAEALLKSLPDSDADGIPDVLSRLMQDSSFSLHKDNWKNRRRVIFGTAGSAWLSCLLMVGIWCFKVLYAKTDIPPNLMQFGTTMFWAMNMFATTLILGYLGFSQADTHNYRKQSVDLAKSAPTTNMNGNYRTSYYDNPVYDNMNVGAQGNGSVAPPTPIATPGPITPKPGIIT